MAKKYQASKRKPTHLLEVRSVNGKNPIIIHAFDANNHKQALRSPFTHEFAYTVNPNNQDEEALFLFGFKPGLYIRLPYLETVDQQFWKISRLNGAK